VVAVTSDDRPQLKFAEPPNWDRFAETIEEKWGTTSSYAGFEIDRAWREFTEEHPAEDYADRLLGAVRRRARDTRERNLLTRGASGTGDGRVWTRVHPKTKEGMQAYATEAGVPDHVVLRGVLWWYLDGGLLGRVTEKLERAVPEAEIQLAEIDPAKDGGLTAEEKKRRWLADHFTGEDGTPHPFTRDDFGDALKEMPYRGGDTEYMRDQHLRPVLDRLEFTEHPNTSDLFVPEEQAEAYADAADVDLDAPAFDRKDYADLDREERVYGLRLELTRRAAKRSNGKSALSASKVRSEVFDGHPSKRTVKDLMGRAARVDGFETDGKGGEKRLTCGLETVTDDDLLADANLPAGATGSGPDDPQANPGVDPGDTEETDPETDVDEDMDALMAATPVTDGGEEQR
jgi:hypothetical protein